MGDTALNTRIVNQAMRELRTNLHGLGLAPKKEQGLTLMFGAIEPRLFTNDDIQLLKEAAKNPKEHPYIKGILNMILLKLNAGNGDPVMGRLDKAYSCFKLVRDSMELVWCRDGETPGFMASIKSNLVRPKFGWLAIWEVWRQWIDGFKNDPGDMAFGNKSRYTAAQKAAIKRRSEMVRDTICANCGIKELQEYHADFQESSSPIRLKRCQSCHDVSYCSHKCQKEAWKPRHKKYCRDVSVLKTGDIVRLRGLKEKSDLNGHLYEIHELNNAAGRWHASWVGGSNDLLIKPGNLTRVLTVEERNDLIANN